MITLGEFGEPTQSKGPTGMGESPDVKLNDFTRIHSSEGQAPVLPAVQIAGDPQKGRSVENLKSEVDVTSLGVIKNNKLAGYSSLFELRDMLFRQGKIKTTTLSAKCEGDRKFGYRVTHSKT